MEEVFKISLKAARVESGLSKEKAAKELGVSVATLNRWERHPEEVRESWWKFLSLVYGIPQKHIRFTAN